MQRAQSIVILLIVACLIILLGQLAVASDSDYAELLYSFQTSELPWENDATWIIDVFFSPNEEFLAVAGRYHEFSILILETETGEVALELEGHTHAPRWVTWSPDETQIASGSYDRSVIIWDADSGDILQTFTYDDAPEWVAYSPDGKYLYTYVRHNGMYKQDTQTWDVVASRGDVTAGEGRIHVASLSPDGDRVALRVDAPRSGISVWDTNTFETIVELPQRMLLKFMSLEWSPDGNYIAGCGNAGIVVWDANTYETVAEVYGQTGILYETSWSADSKYLAAGCNSNNLFVWETENYELVYSDPTGSTILGLDWSAKGNYIATGTSGESMLRVYRWLAN